MFFKKNKDSTTAIPKPRKRRKTTKTQAEEDKPVKYIRKSKKLVKYRFLVVLLSFCVTVFIALFVARVPIFWIYFWIVASAILLFNGFLLLILNIILDWKNLKHKLVVLQKGKFFIDVMDRKDGRTSILYLPIPKTAEFEWNEGTYFLDPEAMSTTEDNIPIIRHHEGIPNPLKYNYTKYFDEYYAAKKEDPNSIVTDWDNELVDVAYSSYTIREFKKDKFFNEFHSDKFAEANKMAYMLVIALMVVAICFVLFGLFIGSKP